MIFQRIQTQYQTQLQRPTVPSVRGDKVLWMCGAHRSAPEGVTRHVKTKGELEPCKLKVIINSLSLSLPFVSFYLFICLFVSLY